VGSVLDFPGQVTFYTDQNNLTMEVTINDLKKILASTSYGKNAELLKGDDFLREEGVDSLDLLDFYLNIEEQYNIKVDDKDVAGLLTLNDYQQYVIKKIGESNN